MAWRNGRQQAWRILLALLFLGSGFGTVGTRQTSVAAASRESRLGLVADIGTRHECDDKHGPAVDTLARTGVTWVKEEIRWDWVEPSRDVFTWTCMDRVIDAERAQGLEILGLLDYTAGWAVGESRPVSPTPPPLDRWANYVRKTAEHYKGRVNTWEVWNEPNFAHFWAGSKEQYADLLRVTYDTIKAVDPTARVLAPAVSGVGTTDEWLAALPADKYDILAIHLYTEPDFLNDRRYSYYDQGLPNLAAVVARHGNKPVWITEFGFSSQGGPQGWYVGDDGAQARYLVQQVAETLAFTGGLKIERMMPYVFNDHEGFELVHGWTNPKPAYAAFQTLSAQLAGATPVGRVDAGAGVFAFRFARDDRQIDIVWSAGGGTATLPSAGDAEVYTLSGSRSVVGLTGAEVRIPVGADPVYVVYPSGGDPGAFTGAGRQFPETGKAVRGPFLAYWQANGGLAINGLPISGEMTQVLEDGKPYRVQYFERARLEWHPEIADPQYRVLLGQFGRRLRPADPAVAPLVGQRFFGETGHNLGGDFRAYWEAHGGLTQFGFPISEEFEERLDDGNVYRVQYFERARFEWHPENAPAHQVLLGQFGRRVYDELAR
jgi:hypothetical protein